MTKRTQIGCFCLSMLVTGCGTLDLLKDRKRDSVEIHVDNQTGGTLSNVTIYVVQSVKRPNTTNYVVAHTDSTVLGDLAPGVRQKGTLYEKNIQGTDGSFEFSALDSNGKKYSTKFGYLTNGAFLEFQHALIVQKDTILIK
ncbi:hypothetical protein [Tellurirhabdus bombi]|uniref:hypothetical protein n=1 Tax=Tellurirhabdus bombi TaxID=2907205 RepID=UPI001F366E0D|nr:hypothetical protein [Tellurirhabdus bombi]